MLYLLPFPLGLTALIALAKGEFGTAMAGIGCLLSLYAGAYLNRRGLREELLAPARRYSRPVRIPYKYLAAGLFYIEIHLPAFVLEDAQARNLPRQILDIARLIVLPDAYEQQKPFCNLCDGPPVDRNPRAPYALYQRHHDNF